ncbi:hypothetical protein TYRP_019879 [Tyrophagus putrescentiae]|nr:hypothetical protein TYRP_019879 [Tyrophagus putrescentiae]
MDRFFFFFFICKTLLHHRWTSNDHWAPFADFSAVCTFGRREKFTKILSFCAILNFAFFLSFVHPKIACQSTDTFNECTEVAAEEYCETTTIKKG